MINTREFNGSDWGIGESAALGIGDLFGYHQEAKAVDAGDFFQDYVTEVVAGGDNVGSLKAAFHDRFDEAVTMNSHGRCDCAVCGGGGVGGGSNPAAYKLISL